MEKTAIKYKPLLKALALVTGGGAAGATAGGIIGHKKGFRTGAVQTADKLTSAFSEANTAENKAITNRFNRFNAKENQAIAKHYMQKGLLIGANMSKQSMLEEVYASAFNDEIEKIAAKPPGGWGKLFGSVKDSLKNLGEKASKGYAEKSKSISKTWKKMKPGQKNLAKGIAGTAAGATLVGGVGVGRLSKS